MRFCSHLFPNTKSQSILFTPSHNSSFYLQSERHYQKEPVFSSLLRPLFFSNSWWITLKTDWGKEEAIFNPLCHSSPNHQPHDKYQLGNHFHVVIPTKLCYTWGFAQASRYSSYQSFKVSAQAVTFKNCIGKASTLQQELLTWGCFPLSPREEH